MPYPSGLPKNECERCTEWGLKDGLLRRPRTLMWTMYRAGVALAPRRGWGGEPVSDDVNDVPSRAPKRADQAGRHFRSHQNAKAWRAEERP
jgi:hypothetical protein